MRFIEEPASAQKGADKYYMVRVNSDPGIYPLGSPIGFELYGTKRIQEQKEKFLAMKVPGKIDDNPEALLQAFILSTRAAMD